MSPTRARATLVATVLRGLRSRALLSVGSVLLTALALGSAVLGPIFQVAVTNSFLVTRLGDAPNPLTGLGWEFRPGTALDDDPTAAQARAEAEADRAGAGFAPAQSLLLSGRTGGLSAEVRLLAKEGSCAHLAVEGSCPAEPGDVLLLAGDAESLLLEPGDTIDTDGFGTLTMTGTYVVPETGEEDYWFDLGRFVSIPPDLVDTGRPYRPAPFLTPTSTFEALPSSTWTVLVDRRLDVPADLTLDDLIDDARIAQGVVDKPRPVEGGTLTGQPFNDLRAVVAETRDQQDTARNSITPAVISLVLVALALLLRLLMAAADLRLPELALASLRGLSRRQMWSLGLSEPLALLLLAIPAGGVLGVAMALGLVRWWLVPGLPLPLPWEAALTGLGVALAAAAVAVLAVGLVLAVSLSDQLTGVRRPRAMSRAALISQLVLVAAAVAVLASKLSAGAPGEPDVTDLILPVLLAVVAGIAATRSTAALATWWTRRRRSRSLPGFVAARAISRRQEGTLIILPVTAAIAICVFGAGVFASAGEWRQSVAATVAPADVVWTSALPLSETVGLTRRLDPAGQYLMAATTVGTQGPSFTVVDASRLARVAAWQDEWTPGVSVDRIAELIGVRATIPTVTGEVLALDVDNGVTSDDDLVLRVRLTAPDGTDRSAYLGPYPPGQSTRELDVPYCRGGCRLAGLTLGAPAALQMRMSGDLRVRDVRVDGAPVPGALDGAGWSVSPDASAADEITGVTADGDGLLVSLESGSRPIIAQLSTGAIPNSLPVVRGVDAETKVRGGAATSRSTDIAVDPVITAGSVPLLGPLGLLIDYGMITADRTLYTQDAPVYVLARGDTPAATSEGLRARGASVSTTLAQERATLDQTAYALALRLYAVVAVLVLLMALAGLFVSTAVQLPARRRDAASLRVVGVSRRSVMSSVAREFAVVLGGTAAAGLVAGTLAQYVVLRTVTLGYVENLTTPALIAAVDWGRLVVLAGVAALVFGVVALASAALTVRGARGSILRESAR